VLGGPQSGIVVGRRTLVEPMERNPLMRALRCDKLILAGLEASLRLFRLAPGILPGLHPVLGMMVEAAEAVEARARALLAALPPAAVTSVKIISLSVTTTTSSNRPVATVAS